MLQCVHVRVYPCTEVTLTIGKHKKPLMGGLAPTLAYRVILGQDWDYFGDLLAELVGPPSNGQGPLPPATSQPEAASLVGMGEIVDPGEGASQASAPTQAHQASSQP